MRPNVILHVAQLAILDIAVQATQLLQAEPRLFVQKDALSEPCVDFFIELELLGGGRILLLFVTGLVFILALVRIHNLLCNWQSLCGHCHLLALGRL